MFQAERLKRPVSVVGDAESRKVLPAIIWEGIVRDPSVVRRVVMVSWIFWA